MADNQLGDHVQGCLDEGKPASQERPVLVAWKNASGNVTIPTLDAAGNIPVDVITSPPVSGTVTANQGAPNAGGAANNWHTITDDISVTGSLINNGDTVTLSGIDGRSVACIDVGSGTGAWIVEGMADGSVPWRSLNCVIIAPSGSSYGIILASNNSGNVLLRADVGGLTAIRIRAQGAITVTYPIAIRAGNANGPVLQAGPVAPFSGQNSGIEGASIDFGFWPTDANAHQLNQKAMLYVSDGANGWFKQRTPVRFVTAQATAVGSSALWTPAAGKKFRLMRYMIQITENATLAVAGVLTISLLDAAGGIGQAHDVWVPAAALTTSGDLYTSPWIDLGDGILSAAGNNILNINLSAALASGNVRVIACGTEE